MTLEEAADDWGRAEARAHDYSTDRWFRDDCAKRAARIADAKQVLVLALEAYANTLADEGDLDLTTRTTAWVGGALESVVRRRSRAETVAEFVREQIDCADAWLTLGAQEAISVAAEG